MPWSLQRFQPTWPLHFLHSAVTTASLRCTLLTAATSSCTTLERARRWHDFYVGRYRVMPEHVHLRISEPARSRLAPVQQLLQQTTAHELRPVEGAPFWERRYYDFNVGRSPTKSTVTFHSSPSSAQRTGPNPWEWSSFPHYAGGGESIVAVASRWTARKREQAGEFSTIKSEIPTLPHRTRQGAGTRRDRFKKEVTSTLATSVPPLARPRTLGWSLRACWQSSAPLHRSR